jgi:pheromone receptor transcription factor
MKKVGLNLIDFRKLQVYSKAYELATLTGTQVLLLVVSETGLVYTYTT